MRIRFWLSLGTCALASSSAFCQIKKKGDRYQFRAQYVAKTVISYDIVTDVKPLGSGPIAQSNQKVTLPVLMQVLEVKRQAGKGGLKVAKIRSLVGPIRVNGALYKERVAETVFVDELNRLQGVGSSEIPQFTTPLPEKPLKLGESWSAAVDAGQSVPLSLKVNATYKLVKVDRTFATIAISLSGKGQGQSSITTTGVGTMVLRVRDGTLERVKMTQNVQAGQGVGAKSTITVTRKV